MGDLGQFFGDDEESLEAHVAALRLLRKREPPPERSIAAETLYLRIGPGVYRRINALQPIPRELEGATRFTVPIPAEWEARGVKAERPRRHRAKTG